MVVGETQGNVSASAAAETNGAVQNPSLCRLAMTDKASDPFDHTFKVPVGMCALESQHGPRVTMDRLAAITVSKGMTNFARIDHGAGAAEAGLPLRPTALLIFGNARGGTPLMQSAQTIGIDLPLKILVWQDAAGRTWLGYNDPHWLAGRHGITAEQAAVLVALDGTLAAIAREAAGESGLDRQTPSAALPLGSGDDQMSLKK